MLNSWQAVIVTLACIFSLTALAIAGDVPAELVGGAIGGIPALVLGAGAVAHGVKQGSQATAAPPPTE